MLGLSCETDRAPGGTTAPDSGASHGTEAGHRLCTVLPMLVSYVLRVHPDRIGREAFAGEVEAVASGRKCGVKSLQELKAFVESTVDDESAAIRDALVGKGDPQ